MPVSAILCLLGCSAGKPFQRPAHDSLALGRTTQAQIIERLGKPLNKLDAAVNGEDLKLLQYGYTPGYRNPDTGVSPQTSMTLYFWKDALVRYEFTSTESATSTDFDTALVEQIHEGSTTREQTIDLLGQPGGYGIFPGIPVHDVTAMIYFCNITTGLAFSPKIHRKVLILPFDQDGVILDVQLTETGKPSS